MCIYIFTYGYKYTYVYVPAPCARGHQSPPPRCGVQVVEQRLQRLPTTYLPHFLPDTRGQPGWNTSTSRGIYIYILVDACAYICTQVMLDQCPSDFS